MYARDSTGAVGYVTPTHTIPSMESFGGYGQHRYVSPVDPLYSTPQERRFL